MPVFQYRAVDPSGQSLKGIIEANNEVAARGLLRDRKLLPLTLTATSARPPAPGDPPPTLVSAVGQQFRVVGVRERKINARTLAILTRQLSTLIGSDVRIEEALQIIARQTKPARVGSLLLDVRGAILEGRSFAAALADHPGAFPEYYRASIAAGEHSGKLSYVMEHLAGFVERRQRAQQKVRLALLYPALLAWVSAAMIVLLLIYVVPNITRVFVSRGADLPLLTRGLIGLSNFIQNYGIILALVLAVLGVLAQRWLAVPANRLSLDKMFATRPPVARLSREINAARFSGSLATLIQSEVPLVDALVSAAAVTPNRYIRQRTLQVAARVREGASLNQSMAEQDVFPTMLMAIVASGESSGRLGKTLSKAADDLDREVDALTSAIVALVEPAVLLFMGAVVMLMVLAILLPIISLNTLTL